MDIRDISPAEVLSFAKSHGEEDFWEIYRNPVLPHLKYFYDRVNHIITTDDITNITVRATVQQCKQTAKAALKYHYPLFVISDEWDLVVRDGVALSLCSWRQQKEFRFVRGPAQAVTEGTLLDFWQVVEQYPFHRSFPAGVEETMVRAIQNQWHVTKVLKKQHVSANLFQRYCAAKESQTYPVGCAQWQHTNRLIAYYFASLMVEWYNVRQTY
ncbi:hypothetical protein HDZ31DRAFT_62393 [Schizophyllum fasciatum]